MTDADVGGGTRDVPICRGELSFSDELYLALETSVK